MVIQNFNIFTESIQTERKSKAEIILKKGSVLFHGTGEAFNFNKLKVGSYDKVLWTADSPLIAQTYIPMGTSKTHVSTQELTKPSNDDIIIKLQKIAGIDDYSDVEYRYNRPTSWRYGKVKSEIIDKFDNTERKYELIKKEKEVEAKFRDEDNPKEKEKLYKELTKIKKELTDLYNDNRVESEFLKHINKKLIDYGLVPIEKNEHNYRYEIQTSFNKILKSGESHKGKLIIITLKKDFKFYDNTMGGSIGGDLTDLEYHKVGMFREVEKRGYDGIIINDFAQSEDMGNYGHKSYGIFSNSLSDVSIEYIDAQHRLISDNPDGLTPEYKIHKK